MSGFGRTEDTVGCPRADYGPYTFEEEEAPLLLDEGYGGEDGRTDEVEEVVEEAGRIYPLELGGNVGGEDEE